MHFNIFLLVSLAYIVGYSQTSATTTSVTASATTAKPQGFQSRSLDAASEDDNDDDFETQAQTHLGYRQQQQHHHLQQQQHQQQHQQQPLYDYSQSEEDQEEPPRQQYPTRKQQQQQTYQANRANSKQKQSSEEETEEEEEEPDRLSQLLAQSKFACNGKTTGYYADDTLNCEVFHYCQENQRHSWICPEGFTFHQIHLICMPPSNDNICQQSSKYHIVNEYLYKPVNLQEHQSKPNVTLRYSERYYPESYYDNDRYEDEEEQPRPRIQHARQPLQVGFHQQQQQHVPQQQQHQSQPQYQRSQAVAQQQQQQVRHHQPIQQQIAQPQQTTVYRKPLPVTTLSPQIQPQLQQIRTQAPAPTVTPSPYRFFTAAPQVQQHLQPNHQQVYRTPEEINISLQQRRPQIFIASTTPRYYEDEYLYERK